MKEDLTLNIGTKYKGDGFKKVDQQLKATAKTVGTASRAIGAISSELGQMEGAVGKAAGAFSGLISTIATGGGPIGLAIAGITAAIALVVKSFRDAKEAAKEAAQTMRDSFSNAIDTMSGRLRGLQGMFANFRKWVSTGIDLEHQNFDLDTRNQRAEQDIQYQNQREGMTSDYDKARNKAEQSYNQGLLETNNTVSKTRAKTLELDESIKLIDEELGAMRSEIADMEHKAAQQFVSTVDADVAKEYKTLQENLKRAQEQALKNGKDAVARKETQTISTGTTSSGVVMTKQVEVSITYAQEMESAAKKLNEFKKKNEESLKGLESYNKTIEKIEEAKKREEEKEQELIDTIEKRQLAQKEEEVVFKEILAQRKKLEEQYKEQIDAIDKQEQAEKDASKLAMMEQEKKQALAGKKGLEAAELELEWTKKIAKEKEEQAKRQMDAEKGSDTKKNNYDLVVKKNESDIKAAELNLKAAKAQKELQDKRAALEKKREELTKADNQTAVQRLAAHKAEQQAAKELAEAEKKAANVMAQWAANPQQNFAQWNQQQQQAQREAEKQQKKQNKNVAQAQNEADRIGKRIFNRNGDLRRTASAFDIGRFAEMSDFLGFKNVNEDQIDQMKDKRDALRRKLFDENGNLKRGVAENGRDVQTFKKLDKALKNVDAVKDAEKKRKEAEEREKKRAENEDKRTQSLQKIQEDIKKLTEKAGI